jgi:hypothetical protein
MNDPGRRVTLLGRTTPVFLRSCGPEVSEADLAAFEATLGYPLPDDYRDFLLRYNGGRPSVIMVTARDDDPTVPYAHGDGIRCFYKLQTAAGPVKNYERLRSPREYEVSAGVLELVAVGRARMSPAAAEVLVAELRRGEPHQH